MDPITHFLAFSTLNYAKNKSISWYNDVNKETFTKALSSIIYKTTNEYKKKHKISDLGEKIAFYDSQVLMDELLKFRLFEDNSIQLNFLNLQKVLKSNPNIYLPEEKNISEYIEIFIKNIKADSELKKLAIEDGYKEKIFEISKNVNDIKNIVQPTIKIPKDITWFNKVTKSEIIGREEDLKNLRNTLLQNQQTALVNGLGGIGKTTLAAVYVNEFYNSYDNIVWLTIGDKLENAIITNFSLMNYLDIKSEKTDDRVEECLNKLRNIQSNKPKLLVLDNANESLSTYYDKLPHAPEWHILVTSRERIPVFKIIDLDFLDEDEAIELFKKYCDNFNDEQIRIVVKKVELHTLTIEILSKSAKKNHWSFEQVNNAMTIDAKTGIEIGHAGHKKIINIRSYLINIFNLDNLDEHEIWLLKQFTALPNQWLNPAMLENLLQASKLDWYNDFLGLLENLVDKGYIQKQEGTEAKKNVYKMHPVLQEVLSQKLGTLLEDVILLVECISTLLNNDQANGIYKEKFQYISFGDAILKLFLKSQSPPSFLFCKMISH